MLYILDGWVKERSGRYVVFRDVHGVVRARSEERLHKAHEAADVIAPDGMPLVWTSKLLGFSNISRVCGPDMLLAACQHGETLGWKHYFYGGAPDVVETLVMNLKLKFPKMVVVGTYSPPFRELTAEENENDCERIRASQADLVWIGLGTPKQELWMNAYAHKCGGAILLGVGAAFDFHAGTIIRAPVWMRNFGLEWAHRLVHEPKRLWRRYLVLAPLFVMYATHEVVSSKLGRLLFGRRKR
jgi:N-acetylglucosaminyldiphosphoundecaprenol N-acetyl-beta-D-mannosaminyltransferase